TRDQFRFSSRASGYRDADGRRWDLPVDCARPRPTLLFIDSTGLTVLVEAYKRLRASKFADVVLLGLVAGAVILAGDDPLPEVSRHPDHSLTLALLVVVRCCLGLVVGSQIRPLRPSSEPDFRPANESSDDSVVPI